MRHLELAVAVRPYVVEAVADIMRRFAPSGVSIEPPFESLDEDGAIRFPEHDAVFVRVWLPADDASSESAIAELQAALDTFGSDVIEPLTTSDVAEADWADAWKEHFQVTRVGERIVLKPSWREYVAKPGDVVVTIDPGRAFGTGQHETTRMCLIELEQRITLGARVLDLGCGSGILSAAAALLGAGHVDAIDIDPAAVSATTENATANDVANNVRVAQGSLGDQWPFPEKPRGAYDVVLANISSRVIRELAGEILSALADDGVALGSGIIADQEQLCLEALVEAGAKNLTQRGDGDWRLLVATP